jgi:hypothetical protein
MAAMVTLAGASPAGPQVTNTGGGVAALLYGEMRPVALTHARAFPTASGGKQYTVLIVSSVRIADADVEADAADLTVSVPEEVQGLVLWIEQGPNQVRNGSLWHPALIEDGQAVEGDITGDVVLDLEPPLARQMKGRIHLRDGFQLNYQPVRLDIAVDVPVTALAAPAKRR